jgi:GTP-binding protein EngB required for normal cell division
MQNVMDEINVLMCGGSRVGKSALLRRLCSMQPSATLDATEGINRVEMLFPLNNKLDVQVNLYDIGGEQLEAVRDSHLVQYLSEKCHAVIMVIDVASEESLLHMDEWFNFLSEHFAAPDRVVKYLVVNKADLVPPAASSSSTSGAASATAMAPTISDNHRRGGGDSSGDSSSSNPLSEDSLDMFVEDAAFEGWAYTVSYALLGDYVVGRAVYGKQQSIASVVVKVVTTVLLHRSRTFYKLWKVPMRLQFKKWTVIESRHYEHYLRLLMGYT